jgi:hypothetical protein
MSFTADEIANINNAVLETFIDKGTVFKQFVANKPMLDAFNSAAGRFTGGKDNVSFAVKAGQGGGTLQGYTHDDQVGYYNPTGIKRARFPWKEHHIGMVVTHSELKVDGIDISSDSNSTSSMDGREEQALANLLEEKMDTLGEDYAASLDTLVHGDGTSDTKALAGIRSLILDNPATGTTGGIGRVANSWWRNRARTATAAAGNITSSTADGGALIAVLETEYRQLSRYKQGQTRWKMFAGSDFIDAYLKEIRANGNYSDIGFRQEGVVDGGMSQAKFKGIDIMYDPTLDSLSLAKRMYWLDMGRTGVRLLYMDGQRMKKHSPARPYDRYVMYNGITMTGVMIAKQLNTSGVYDIA